MAHRAVLLFLLALAAFLTWGTALPEPVLARLEPWCGERGCALLDGVARQAVALQGRPLPVHGWTYGPGAGLVLQALGPEPRGWLHLGAVAGGVLLAGLAAWVGRGQPLALGLGAVLVMSAWPVRVALESGDPWLPVTALLTAGLVGRGRAAGLPVGLAAALHPAAVAGVLALFGQRRARAGLVGLVTALGAGVLVPWLAWGRDLGAWLWACVPNDVPRLQAALGSPTYPALVVRWFVDGDAPGLPSDGPLLPVDLSPALVAGGGAALAVLLAAAVVARVQEPEVPLAARGAAVALLLGLLAPGGWSATLCAAPIALAVALAQPGGSPAFVLAVPAALALATPGVLLALGQMDALVAWQAWGGTGLAALVALGAVLLVPRGGEGT